MAVASPPKAKAKPANKPVNPGRPKTPNKVGRPKTPLPKRAFRKFKTGATGETRNSPTTDPNIIFWLGIALIIFSGWSSGRIKDVFAVAWGSGGSPTDWLTNIKVIGSQFLFVFILSFTARVAPPLARIWLVIIVGLWILYLMKNPQIIQLLNWTSVGAQNQQQYNKLVNNVSTATGGNVQHL